MTTVAASVKLKTTVTASTNSVTVSSGSPVTVKNNAVTVGTPASGTTFLTTTKDSAGADVGTAAQDSVVSNSTIVNSNSSYSASVVAEGSLTIPDTDIQVNGAALISQPSTITKDVVVKYANGTPTGTITAGEVVVDNPIVCADVTEQINGSTIGTVASGGTNNQVVQNSAATQIGTAANPSVIGDATININGVNEDAIEAEQTFSMFVKLDGVNSGSYDEPTKTVNVTSPACADATVTVNSITMETIPSGSTENIEVRQETGATLVGSKQGQYWRIDNSQAQVNGVNTETIAATVTHDQAVHDSAGADVGTSANPSVIADATVRNNSTPTWSDTVKAEDTLTLAQGKALDSDGITTLLADYIPNTSGFMFTCSAGGGGGSLSVGLSDATPDYLDSITITATPTGITPTSYTFFLPNIDGTYTEVTQAGNTYAWTVGVDGLETVTVTATDGVDEVTGTVNVTATWTLGKAIDLNGTTQSVETINNEFYNLMAGQVYGLGFWFNADSLANDPIFYSGNNINFLQIKTTGVRIRTGASDKTYNTTLAAATNYFVYIRRNNIGNNIDVFVNGVDITSTTGTVGNSDIIDVQMTLGDYTAGGFEFNGKIAEIFTHKLISASDAQVLTHYNSGSGKHVYRLIDKHPNFHIDFENRVTDQGTAGIDCQLVNAPSYVTF